MNLAKHILCLVFLCGLTQVRASTPHPYLQELDYSSHIDYLPSLGVVMTHNSIVNDILSAVPPPLSSDTPVAVTAIRAARVDGYHKDINGLMYFSFDNDVVLNTNNVLKSDIIRCNNSDCSSFTYIFDSDFFNLKHLNINAFTFDPNNGDLIFSIDNAGVINGISYLPADLIRFNATTSVFSLEYDSFSSVFGLGVHKNIDAVSLLSSGHFLISLVNDGNYKGLFDYNNADVLDYIPSTHQWSVTYGTRSPLLNYPINLSALMATIRNEMFADGFE